MVNLAPSPGKNGDLTTLADVKAWLQTGQSAFPTISFAWEAGQAEAYLEIGNTRYSAYVKIEGQEPIYIEGRANELDQRIVELIHEAVFRSPPVGATITQIEDPNAIAARLAA